jgi:hypothetical protein
MADLVKNEELVKQYLGVSLAKSGGAK